VVEKRNSPRIRDLAIETPSIELWGVDEVCNWLKSLGEVYEKYVPSFRSYAVDGSTLLKIEQEEELKEDFNIQERPVRRKIWSFIEAAKKKKEAPDRVIIRLFDKHSNSMSAHHHCIEHPLPHAPTSPCTHFPTHPLRTPVHTKFEL
jgi:hypothetical protein